ncbi:hypothetical protein K1719_043167 [Acacia pycnantha]|nr:hypothetical protein K1719_043167 [Acacia pycnantha]
MESKRVMERELKNMRDYFKSSKTKEESWRECQLQGLRRFLIEREQQISTALLQNLRKHPVEAFKDEVGTVIKSINFALKNLREWMSGQKAKLPQIALLTSAEIVPEPLGPFSATIVNGVVLHLPPVLSRCNNPIHGSVQGIGLN